MGNEYISTRLGAIVAKVAQFNQPSAQHKGTVSQAKPLENTDLQNPQQEEKNSPEKTTPANTLLVFETNERLMSWYNHLEGRHFDRVVGYSNIESLAYDTRHIGSARCIIMEIQEGRFSDSRFVLPVLESYPNAGLILTVPSGATLQFSDVGAYSDRVQILERPFSMARLVELVRQPQIAR